MVVLLQAETKTQESRVAYGMKKCPAGCDQDKATIGHFLVRATLSLVLYIDDDDANNKTYKDTRHYGFNCRCKK